MATTTAGSPGWGAAALRRRGGIPSPSQWPQHWPLTVLLVGFPLWWALGMSAFMPLIVAVPMLLQVLRRHPIRVPDGFGWWLVFLACVVLSVTMLFVDAPGAVPGGGPSRLIVFTYRVLWYLACAIVLLWVVNLDEAALPTRRVIRLMSWMFIVTVMGGLLGVLVPNLEFTSPVEALLPGALRSNNFVRSLVHPQSAAVQSILGTESPRPIAPFSFANSWGANVSMFLPFFLVGWLGKEAGWRRSAAPVVLVLASVPIVLSLNRGLWLSLALGVVYYVLRLVMTGRVLAIVGAAAVVVIASVTFLVSPLGDMVSNRLETPHSNDRRGELLTDTVVSTAIGSPVLGFGSTRDVQGSFASIAGGSRPDCSACSVPPLGTQGQIWLVIFAQGFVGLGAFAAFYLSQLARHWRSRTTVESVGVCLLLFFVLQLFVYDTLGMPMYTLMIAIGLMWRERTAIAPQSWSGVTLESLWARLRRSARLILVLSLFGAVLGGIIALQWTPRYDAKTAVLLEPAPIYIDPSSGELDELPQEITIDTEASMVFSEDAITAIRDELDLPVSFDVRDAIRVTAPPNSKVLEITARADDPGRAEGISAAAASAYLAVRNEYLEQRRGQVRRQLEARLDAAVMGSVVTATAGDGRAANRNQLSEAATEEEIREALSLLELESPSAGQVLRTSEPKPVRKPVEVPVVSGMLLGALSALALMGWHEAGRRRPTAASRTDPWTRRGSARPTDDDRSGGTKLPAR